MSWFAQGLWILGLGLMCLLGIWICAVAAMMLEYTKKNSDENPSRKGPYLIETMWSDNFRLESTMFSCVREPTSDNDQLFNGFVTSS